MSYIGWSIQDWIKFHHDSTPAQSLALLLELAGAQTGPDPAWISVVSPENLAHQWDFLQSHANKSELALYGVPVAIKDNIDVKNLATTAACPSFEYWPDQDATTVQLLRAQGAIIIGKTNLDQFATGLVGTRSPYGVTPNTINQDYVVGGSSAGSASVVARGIVPVALGTDTAGSGRVPASLNNLIGLKPTKGLLSCNGVVPACKSLDCVSIFALTLQDAQLCLNILSYPDPENDEYSRQFPESPLTYFHNPTIGIPYNLLWYGETENPKIFDLAAKSLESLYTLKSIDIDPFVQLARLLYEGPWVTERYVATSAFLGTNPPKEDLDPTVLSIIKGGEHYTAIDCFKSEYKRQALLQKIDKVMDEVDVLVVPTNPLTPTIEQIQNEPIKLNSCQGTYTNFVNLADLSALSIPAGYRPDGLPFGITLLSKKFNDYALLDVANKFLKVNSPSRYKGCLQDKPVGTGDELLPQIPAPALSAIRLAVVGAHLKGFGLHWQLQKCNATFIQETKTSKNYKLYCLPKAGPIMKPGLKRVAPKETGGAQISLEVYSIPLEKFGTFMAMVPQPLGIGSVELESGEIVKSFICEESGYMQSGTRDITQFGGWKNFMHHETSQTKKPFQSVLVANRGEIAVRIIKTLKKLNIKAIAVYSDIDKYAQHVLDADMAIPLHGVSAAETYISIDKIILAAKTAQAEAIIPGYGFLSENADFSDRCGQEGIVFVGPSGDAIRKLGLKHSAREIAKVAGVPLVPGSDLIKSAKEARQVANDLTYPVMVKSTAGGGGIGLQKCDSEAEIERIFETVQHQGKSYFGDDGVFLERFVENSRHVEIQILGDGFGKAIAVGERDCSLQRRNQKVIEETPAPNLPEATRAKMRQAGASLALVLRYKCAGTVEFIYDQARDEFYFLEVNARLQVEHPITEMVTGMDLVEWMLLLAADMAPDLDQQTVTVTGASMEARLYAENPVKDFMPSPGQLTEVKFPAWARVDGWVHKGTVVSAEYDPTLAKIIVHGKDRTECLAKLRAALNETVVYGCITNVDYLRSIANSEMFAACKMHTKVLDAYHYAPTALEILQPGAYTTVQDYPGRKGFWHIGVPPSGCMDEYSFRVANRVVGNHAAAPGIEITLNGPKILFHHSVVIAITGGKVDIDINGKPASQWEPLEIRAGDKVSIGKVSKGCRAYLAIRGGIDVTEYLGSRSTFALGNLGGYNGRVLKLGDVLFLGQPELPSCSLPEPISAPISVPKLMIPSYDFSATTAWQVGVTCGPHGSPDFFKPESVHQFFTSEWKVHYNSNRFGVRLIGPKPNWARADGGEAGLHPSNAHDYVYSLGAINFTGDEPVILTCDGPSLGGFVCEAVVAEAEMWKIGQVKPGDMIQFVPLSYETAKNLKKEQDDVIGSLKGDVPSITGKELVKFEKDLADISSEISVLDPVLSELTLPNSPKVVYRQAGDRYVLVEYGDNVMDLNLSYRIHKLIEIITERRTQGIVEMSQGVRSVLIEYNAEISQSQLVKTLVSIEKEIVFVNKWSVKSRVIKLPMAFEDQKTLDAVKRYAETIRSEAPWLPNNVDFIASINGVERDDIKNMLYAARFLVLGLGDVFLGAPCAVPLDPRHRFLGTKYNPSRTFTPNGTVGIGGNYMCIYTMESPGGYQLVGRTVPIWDKLALGAHSADQPWLLSPFDQVEFYPVSEAEIDRFSEEMNAGQFKVDIVDSVFDHTKYLEWVQANSESIEKFQQNQGGDKLEEFNRLIQVSNAELAKRELPDLASAEEFGDNAEMVYSEYSGRFWKPLVEVGQVVKEGDGLVVVEAMKTEMVVAAPVGGKVVKIVHKNGDMVDAGDLVVVIE